MTIALALRSATASAGVTAQPASGPGLAIPLLAGSTVALSASPLGRQSNAEVSAVTAAVAAEYPSEMLRLARTAREKPEDLPVLEKADLILVEPVLSAVREARNDPNKSIDVLEIVRAAAGQVGASPRLSAAALTEIRTDPAQAAAAGAWVANLASPDSMERAARAALRSRAVVLLDPAVAAKTLEGEVQALERQVAAIDPQLVQLRADVDALKQMVP